MPLTPTKYDQILIKRNPYKEYESPKPKYEKEVQLRMYFRCESQFYNKNMKVNLWYSKNSNQWRWTLSCDEDVSVQESGGQEDLRVAMSDVANTIEYLMETKFPD